MAYHVDLSHEFSLRARGFQHVAGLDEAGRGAWAGPVVAGAVIFPLDRFDLLNTLAGVNDSKQLTPSEREKFLPLIANTALSTGVGYATHTEIDDLGIVPATRLAMQRALAALSVPCDVLLIDAVDLPAIPLPSVSLIKGDQRALSIAAASIIAKVTRDAFMTDLDSVFPQYGFRVHKGYGTPLHQQALRNFGPCSAHRLTFAPVQTLGSTRDKDGTS